MKTMNDFLIAFRERIKECIEAKLLLEELEREVGEDEWCKFLELQIGMDSLLKLRNGISAMFADRISGVCTDKLYDRLHRKHTETIQKLDELAGEMGVIIVKKRACVSYTESARDAGIIQVTTKGVSLTPLGERIAEEVRRQIEE